MSVNYEGFNGGQIEAIKHGVGPAVVAAPAGSGKTSCFVNRIARLLFEEGVAPNQVLGMTFTKAAASSMKDRLQKLIPNNWHEDLQISTIHSICWAMLRDADRGLSSQMNANMFLIPSYVVKNINEAAIGRFAKMYGLDPTAVKSSSIKSAISLAKNYRIPALGSSSFFASRGFANTQFLEDAYRYYERERLNYVDKKNPSFRGRYDQDDVLVMVAELLSSDAVFRKRWGSKFKFILVDEVQDTSPVQFEIVDFLMHGGEHRNVMLVGDLRQSIYGFRGAFPQYIQQFTDKYEAKVINLSFNYRSKPEIVEIANRIARKMVDIDDRFRADMQVGRV